MKERLRKKENIESFYNDDRTTIKSTEQKERQREESKSSRVTQWVVVILSNCPFL